MYHVLISQVAKEIINNEGITGYDLKEISPLSVDDLLLDEKKELKNDGYKVMNFPSDPPVYFRMFVEEGAILHPDSKVHLIEKCNECGYQKYATVGNS